MMLCIKNGMVVDGILAVPYKADILIDKGKVINIGKDIENTADEVIDAAGKWVLPGLVDAHCHLREPGFEYKEDIGSGTRSAAAGGFTSVACMANTNPVVDSAAMVNYIKSIAMAKGVVKVYPIAAVTKGQKGEELTEMGELKEAGAVALSDDGRPIMNSHLMRLALQYAKGLDMLIISHCEDLSLVGDGVMNEGYMSTVLGLKGITRAAEEVMVARDIILAETLDAPIHIAHVSTRGSVELIRQAKRRGVRVTCETAPHYFSATDAWVDGYDANAKVNPPLRTDDDVEAIKQGLKDGTIDIIATDHAPHHRDDKEVEYGLAANGISGFETAFSLAYTNLVETGILSMVELVQKMSKGPADILNIDAGTIGVGKPADIIVVDLDREYTVDVSKFYSKGKNSPFHGHTLKGKVIHTIVDGRIVMKDERVIV
ncbi:dihydroorotase [Caldicoprobacter algeriensis]|uniref:dihydroorotase n=1 Tax=Caldicoprobacter algeriensis TaxID=699281 RepID=UPI002079B49B|nr:dihydroorotase [Caldicoprobacter algeriensis]MCM8899674.1 dihydroorotase [Caldicoprobacter algeriensis]